VADLSFSWPEPVRDADIDMPMADAVPEFLVVDEAEHEPEPDNVVVLVGNDGNDDALDVHDCDTEVLHLHAQLAEAENVIVGLEADRTAARKRIEQLEAAEEWAQAVIHQQRRRLLLLERQVEDIRPMWADVDDEVDEPEVEVAIAPEVAVELEPVPVGAVRTSWLDRLLGGVSTPVTVDA
jgi:hypothetical protein